MTLALHVRRVLQRVEVEDVGVRVGSSSEEMTSIAEPDLSAVLEGEGVVLVKLGGQDVVHADLVVAKGNDDVEATWVEGHSFARFAMLALLAHFELALSVVPQADVSV